MRHGYRFMYGTLFLALSCLGLGDCVNPAQEALHAGDTGMVRIWVGSEGRTLMPSLPAVSGYHFSFESPGRNTVERDSASASLELELSVGFWTLTVTALAGAGSGAKEIARGSAALEVRAGMTSSVTVQLGNKPGGEPGALRYTIAFPDTVSEALLTLISTDGGEDSTPVDLLTGSTLISGVRTKTGVLNVAAGNYQVVLDLYGSAGNAKKTEAAHIYANTETSGAYTFTAADFTPTVAYTTGSGKSLSAVLTAIGTASGTDFTIILDQDEPAFTPFTLYSAAYNGKRLRIRGKGHTVTLDEESSGSLFTLETGVVLELQDLTLQGRGLEFENSGALVRVNSGDLLVDFGTIITGNSSSYDGGGVYVGGGAFTMSGGSITGNSSSSSSYGGGGVCVSGGAFTMSGGSITGNSSNRGGGVRVSGGAFTMSGGSITGNSSYGGGGGVCVSGGSSAFTMSGGSITGNSSSSYGGGVYVRGSAFTMSTDARVDPSNEVCLYYSSSSYASITVAGNFTGSDTVAVIDLQGSAADWLGKSVLALDTEYTGTIPASRFSLGNFISGTTKTPIGGNFVIDSDGKLVNN
jgi:hypothetical protein